MSSKRKNLTQTSRQRLLNVAPVSNKRRRLIVEEEEEDKDEKTPLEASLKPKGLKRQISDENGEGNDPLIVNQETEKNFTVLSLRDFEPESSKELVMSGRKLNELKSWFRQQFGSYEGKGAAAVASTSSTASTSSMPPTGISQPFLLLNGPSGAGKTTSMQLLCREFGVQLIELSTVSIFKEDDLLKKDIDDLIARDVRYRMRLERYADDDEDIKGINEMDVRQQFRSLRPLNEESQLNRFHRFLTDLQHYRRTVFDRLDSKDRSSAAPRKLLLIEEIPSVFQMYPEKLHSELLALYEQFGAKTVPMVFIFSDLTNTTSGHGATSDEFRLLPKWLQAKLQLQVITFMPVSEFAMKKTLTRINKTHLKGQLSTEAIEEVVAASSGDIRNALNYLIFRNSVQSTPPSSSSSSSSSSASTTKKARGSKQKKSNSSSSKTNGQNGAPSSTAAATSTAIESGREDQLTLTHAIGRIMYAKRTGKADSAAVEYLFAKSSSSSSNFDRSLLRNVQEYERPEEIAVRSNASADTLLEWSYENFPDFLSNNSADSEVLALNQAVDCLEVLSTADATLREGGFESRPTMEAIRASYVIRGQMFSLNREASAYEETLEEIDKSRAQGQSSSISSKEGGSQQKPGNNSSSTTFKRNKFTFHHLRGPKFWAQHRSTEANLSQLVALKEAGLYRGASLEADRNLVMDILPAVASISSVSGRLATMDGGLRRFAAEMANFGDGGGFIRQPMFPGDDGGGGGFIAPSSTQGQYSRSNLPLALQRRSPFLKLGDTSSDDDEEDDGGQGLLIEADSD